MLYTLKQLIRKESQSNELTKQIELNNENILKPSVQQQGKWANNLYYVFLMEYYSAIIMNHSHNMDEPENTYAE